MRTKSDGTWLLLSFLFFATEALAQKSARTAEQAYAVADLIQGEYGQDLAQAKLEAEALLARPGDKDWAALYAARVYRLRGEYSLAQMHAQRASQSADLRLQAFGVVEQRWAEFDRMQLPWGAVNPFTPHALCQEPEVVLGGLNMRSRWQAITTKAAQAGQQDRLNEAIALRRIEEALENAAMMTDMGIKVRAIARIENHPDKLQGLETPARDALATLRVIALGAHELAPHLPALEERVLAPALARVNLPAVIAEHFPCAQADLSAQPVRALHCAERALFPGGTPEDLGHSVNIGQVNISSAQVPELAGQTVPESLQGWVRQRKAQDVSRAHAWLAQAERRLANQRRALARIWFVRGADLLAQEIVEAPKGPVDAKPAIAALNRALTEGQAAGDGVLLRRSQALLAFAHAIRSERREAESFVLSLVQNSASWPAQSVAFGTLLDSLAHAWYENRHDASIYIRLASMSERLYRNAQTEAGISLMQRGEVLEVMGMSRGAAAVYRQAWLQLFPDCDARAPEKCELSTKRCKIDGYLPAHHWYLAKTLAAKLASITYNNRDADGLSLWIAANHSWVRQVQKGLGALAQQGVGNGSSQQLAACDRNKIPGASPDAQAAAEISCRAEKLPAFLQSMGVPALADSLPAVHSLMQQQSYSLADVKDRQQLVTNPDLPLRDRYATSLTLALSLPTDSKDLLTMAAYLNAGRSREAFLHWKNSKARLQQAAKARLHGLGKLSGDIETHFKVTNAISLGWYAVLVHDYPEAERQLGVLRSIAGGAKWYEQSRDPSDALYLQISAMTGLGKTAEAIQAADYAVRLLEDRRNILAESSKRGSLYAQNGMQGVFRAAILAASRSEDASRVFAYIQRAKARALQESLLTSAAQDHKLVQLEQALSELALQLDRCQPRGGGDCDYRFALRDKLEQAVKQEQAKPPMESVSARIPTDSEVAEQLPAGTLLLDYYVAQDFLHVVILERGRKTLQAAIAIPHPAEVQGRAERLRGHMGSGHRESLPEVRRDLNILSQLLLQSKVVRQALRQPHIKELALVPHMALHSVPFAMLPFDGKRLVERFSLRYLPFAALPRSPAQPTVARDAALLFASGRSSEVSTQRKLSIERPDLVELQSVYGPLAKTIQEASRDDFLKALSQNSIVHLIAHATSGTDLAQSAQIALKADDCSGRPGCDTGELRVSDLYAAPAHFSARLVYVDACLAAVGRNQVGDENIGIPRALLQKGAAGVVAPLWEIYDAPKSHESADFHRQYHTGRLSAAESLAQVQRRAIAAGKYAYQWAGHVVFGWE